MEIACPGLAVDDAAANDACAVDGAAGAWIACIAGVTLACAFKRRCAKLAAADTGVVVGATDCDDVAELLVAVP